MLQVKYSKHFLNKLEDIFAESNYTLRYEKGNFKSGYCILNDNNIVIVNKYYTLEGKINCLIEIIREVEMDTHDLCEKNKRLYFDLQKEFKIDQTRLEL